MDDEDDDDGDDDDDDVRCVFIRKSEPVFASRPTIFRRESSLAPGSSEVSKAFNTLTSRSRLFREEIELR